jgi:predicted transcriptional regulator
MNSKIGDMLAVYPKSPVLQILRRLSFDFSCKKHTLSDTSLLSYFWMMTTMTSLRFTMRLDPELKDWLETEAKRKDRSAAYVAKQAIQDLKNKTEAKAQMIREAVTQADKGVFISEDKMTAWFESLGTDHELPEPQADILLNQA